MYYVYQHIRDDLNEPFYIGMGTLKNVNGTYKTEHYRAYEVTNRTKYWKNITSKTSYRVEIIFETSSFEEAQNKEKELIKLYGRKIMKEGSLCNFEEGGNGYLGRPKGINDFPIYQIDKNSNEIIKTWKNLFLIQKELGFLKTNISKCCRKKALTSYGYKWEYANIKDFYNVYPSASRKKISNRWRPIDVFDLNGNLLYTGRKMKDAGDYLNIHISTVFKILNKRTILKGFIVKRREVY